MKNIMLLSFFFTLACAQTPKKEYRWVSLSEQGYTQHRLQVMKEETGFHSDKGFDQLRHEKQPVAVPPSSLPQKILLVGDTGCRLKENPWGSAYQNCNDGKNWIYPHIAQMIADEKADVVIHVGDYHYRENCTKDEAQCRQLTDVIGKGWRVWEAEFFAPSQKALAVSPWVFVRGNHESCERAYEGYRLLSDQPWEAACMEREKTEYIPLGDVLLVKIDSNKITDWKEKPEVMAAWEQEFKNIEEALQKTKTRRVWLLSHKPLTALFNEGGKEGVQVKNVNLLSAFDKTHLRDRIELVIAGHLHFAQFLRAKNYPAQIVVGNSGTALDEKKVPGDPGPLLKGKIDGVQYQKIHTDTQKGDAFGYGILTRTKNDRWQLQFKNAEGQVTFTELL